MIVLKLLHFWGAASFAITVFASYFYHETLLLTKEQVGLILCLAPLVSLFSIPTVTWIAERYPWIGLKKMLIFCTLLGSTLYLCHLLLVPGGNTIVFLILITVSQSMTLSSVGSLIDSLTLLVLPDKQDYGKQRLFGSLSWGLSMALTGYLMDVFESQWVMFYVFAGCISLFFVTSVFIPKEHIGQIEEEVDETEPLLVPEDLTLWQAICRPRDLFFFLTIGQIGMVLAILANFLFIYLSTTWKLSSTLIGFTTPFSIFFELIVFFNSNWFLEKWGTTNMILVSHALLFLRLVLYIILPSLLDTRWNWIALPLELLHGAIFGLYWAAGMQFVQEIAPPPFKSTYVGFLNTVNNNLGGALGTIVGGLIYERLGYGYLFGFCLVLVTISLGLFAISKQIK
ncbi:major facilitator superfamily domain-containing protein [Gorgonomyces haynaldii]|nr:major facilitator superfamily domain-containing protein [Gorgonomyces haynaldii]